MLTKECAESIPTPKNHIAETAFEIKTVVARQVKQLQVAGPHCLSLQATHACRTQHVSCLQSHSPPPTARLAPCTALPTLFVRSHTTAGRLSVGMMPS